MWVVKVFQAATGHVSSEVAQVPYDVKPATDVIFAVLGRLELKFEMDIAATVPVRDRRFCLHSIRALGPNIALWHYREEV